MHLMLVVGLLTGAGLAHPGLEGYLRIEQSDMTSNKGAMIRFAAVFAFVSAIFVPIALATRSQDLGFWIAASIGAGFGLVAATAYLVLYLFFTQSKS